MPKSFDLYLAPVVLGLPQRKVDILLWKALSMVYGLSELVLSLLFLKLILYLHQTLDKRVRLLQTSS